MSNIRDVALRAGVSPSSVTRVLGGYPNVSPELRERVLRAVDEVNYQPDLLAAGLRRGYTKTVGMLVNDVLNPFNAQMMDIFESELRRAGYNVILTNSNGLSEVDLENLLVLKQRRVDGLVASFADDRNPLLATALRSWTVPVVLFDRQVDDIDVSAVLSDHRYGAQQLSEHLVDKGHRRLAMISGSEALYSTRERILGMQDVAQEHGLTIRPDFLISGRGSEEHGSEGVARLLDDPEPPTAIVLANGNTAAVVGALAELRRRKVRIGEDIAVATYYDDPVVALWSPSLTSVWRHVPDMARRAADMMLHRLEDGRRMAHTVVLPTRLMVRESTSKQFTDG
ncbi:LacI family DNA-binding transcriptional regulator [Serinicoccus kebangsaanensis]|uniref:LacI family DNA-binding transcriptional regulator n=1 Tax=Serinicoccus kebangsaanensis TaxID=2602069 RepID=UPI00124C0D3E|nr:LacI family DNA-binding transcriptional regulator [Serinicoccus kebangsaanensis]